MARSESGVAPGYDRGGCETLGSSRIRVISFVSFQEAESYAAAFVATFYLLDLCSIGLERMVPLVQTAQF